MVKEISSIDEIPKDSLVVIDFFAIWCAPCKNIASVFAELESLFPSITFLKVNIDDSESIADHFNVTSLPTFVFLKNNNPVNRVDGANVNLLIKYVNDLSK